MVAFIVVVNVYFIFCWIEKLLMVFSWTCVVYSWLRGFSFWEFISGLCRNTLDRFTGRALGRRICLGRGEMGLAWGFLCWLEG